MAGRKKDGKKTITLNRKTNRHADYRALSNPEKSVKKPELGMIFRQKRNQIQGVEDQVSPS
jgi:hypothetical protein